MGNEELDSLRKEGEYYGLVAEDVKAVFAKLDAVVADRQRIIAEWAADAVDRERIRGERESAEKKLKVAREALERLAHHDHDIDEAPAIALSCLSQLEKP